MWKVGGCDAAGDEFVLRNKFYLADWKRSLLVPFQKDGDSEEVGNCRGVAFGCSMEGILENVGEEVGKVC